MITRLKVRGERKKSRWVVVSDGAEPTEDIYFLGSAAPWLRSQAGIACSRLKTRRWYLPKAVSLLQLAGANLLICRSLPVPWLAFLEQHKHRFSSIVYLIDDDLSAVADANELPESYRQRLNGIVTEQQPRLLTLADEVVASSEYLAEQLRPAHHHVSVLTPPLASSLPSLEHFKTDALCIGYHGTRAHLQDLTQIAPALQRLHQEYSQLEFEVMLGQFTPEVLASLSRVSTPTPMPWAKFRHYQQQRRIHIGLAPLLDTPFNRGKSHIKFLDIAAMGGVGVYSRRYPYTEIVEHGVDGLLVGDGPGEWYQALRRLVDNPKKTEQMALAAAEKARRVGKQETVQQFWLQRTEQV